MAIGCSDSTVRLYDRRMLGTKSSGNAHQFDFYLLQKNKKIIIYLYPNVGFLFDTFVIFAIFTYIVIRVVVIYNLSKGTESTLIILFKMNAKFILCETVRGNAI